MTEVYSWCADQARVSDCVTLDVDSTAITRFGHQQGAEVGYNPRYHGRKSHHPLLAFLTELNLIVNFWLRPGNSHTANNIEGFLLNLQRKITSSDYLPKKSHQLSVAFSAFSKGHEDLFSLT